jgi:hypothetical protein
VEKQTNEGGKKTRVKKGSYQKRNTRFMKEQQKRAKQ